jgi:hypothetical protein
VSNKLSDRQNDSRPQRRSNFVDYVMQRCLSWGMTVLLGLNDSRGSHSRFYRSSDAVVQGYAAFLGNRYRSFPNLIGLLGSDADPNKLIIARSAQRQSQFTAPVLRSPGTAD